MQSDSTSGPPAGSRDDLTRLVAEQPRKLGAWLALSAACLADADPAAAVAAAQEAVRVAPLAWDAHAQLAATERVLGDDLAALNALDMALRFNPRALALHVQRIEVLTALGETQQALTAIEGLSGRVAGDPAGCLQLASCAQDAGGHPLAITLLDPLIASDPGHAQARWRRSFSRLVLGDLRGGFADYEWRFQVSAAYSRPVSFHQPIWTGAEDLVGRRILVHCEQGLGDTLQFCRYATELAARGARVVVVTRPPLKPLLETLEGVEKVRVFGDPVPEADFQCGFMSLPHAFATDLDTVQARTPYLTVDVHRSARWRAQMGSSTAPRVGLAWRGNPAHRNDRNRSLALSDLIASLPRGPDYWVLQYDLTAEERALLANRPDLHLPPAPITDLADTAALCANLDLVISVDTSIAHLAGALSLPVWVLLPANSDWRWLLERTDSPWYPTARLFRRRFTSSWRDVLVEVAAELSQLKG